MAAAPDVLSNANLDDCPENCFRPVGLAWDSGGRLYMTSDSTGEVYVLMKSEASGTGGPSSTPPDDGAGILTPADSFAAVMAAGAVLIARLAAIL